MNLLSVLHTLQSAARMVLFSFQRFKTLLHYMDSCNLHKNPSADYYDQISMLTRSREFLFQSNYDGS